MLDLQKRRAQVVLVAIALIALSMTAEKFREMVGEEAASKSGQFTFLNCFDMGSGSLACGAKEGVKLYVYNLRSAHVERVRQRAIEKALADAISEGLTPADAAKQAQKVGTNAAKSASRQAKRILGPLISSGWDFFEAMYYGGTMTEGFLRGTGTLLGTYMGGYHGEQRIGGRIGGKIGYLMGSHIGSWIGARVGLMVYDVVNGVSYLVSFVQPEDSYQGQSNYGSEESQSYESPKTSYEYEYEGREDREDREETRYYESPESSYGEEYKSEERSEEHQYAESPDEEARESEGFSLF